MINGMIKNSQLSISRSAYHSFCVNILLHNTFSHKFNLMYI